MRSLAMRAVTVTGVSAIVLASCTATPTSPTRVPTSGFGFEGGRGVFADSAAGWSSADVATAQFAAVVARTFIVMANLASARGDNAQVSEFAAQMLQANTLALQDLTEMTDDLISGDLTIRPSEQPLISSLSGTSGSEFDAAYTSAMVTLMESAIAIFRGIPSIGATPLREHIADRISSMSQALVIARELRTRTTGF